MEQHFIVWFEIPATDIERAAVFYSKIFDTKIEVNNDMGIPMAFFPGIAEQMSVTGSLVQYEEYQPSKTHGPLVYLNGGKDLSTILNRVEGAGGKVTKEKTQISPEVGYMGIFIDTEGNRIALHSEG